MGKYLRLNWELSILESSNTGDELLRGKMGMNDPLGFKIMTIEGKRCTQKCYVLSPPIIIK